MLCPLLNPLYRFTSIHILAFYLRSASIHCLFHLMIMLQHGILCECIKRYLNIIRDIFYFSFRVSMQGNFCKGISAAQWSGGGPCLGFKFIKSIRKSVQKSLVKNGRGTRMNSKLQHFSDADRVCFLRLVVFWYDICWIYQFFFFMLRTYCSSSGTLSVFSLISMWLWI